MENYVTRENRVKDNESMELSPKEVVKNMSMREFMNFNYQAITHIVGEDRCAEIEDIVKDNILHGLENIPDSMREQFIFLSYTAMAAQDLLLFISEDMRDIYLNNPDEGDK